AYFTKHRPYYAAEEAEYSAFIIRNPSITFLILPQHLVELPFGLMRPNTAKFCTLHGVYTLPVAIAPEALPSPFPNLLYQTSHRLRYQRSQVQALPSLSRSSKVSRRICGYLRRPSLNVR
ncbi:hypothetical protein FRB94_009700, partial [Tulasnella sp. JGI-2019a]